MKFLADSMLGSLAKKLRLLGIDTVYASDADDGELRYLVRSRAMILLTKDRSLARSLGDQALLVEGTDVRSEFLSVARKLPVLSLNIDPFSRCLQCNEALVGMTPAQVRGKVPPYVLRSQKHFSGCPACGKVFWQGTHSEGMKREVEWMESVLGSSGPGNASDAGTRGRRE